MINYSVGIIECLEKIFGGVLVGGLRSDNVLLKDIIKSSKINLSRFTGFFPSNIFKDEYAIFYEILVTANAKTFSVNQLRDIIDNNRDLVLNTPYVDKSRFAKLDDGRQATDDEIIDAFILTLTEKLIELSNMYVDESEFSSSCNIFIDWYKKAFLAEVSTNMAAMMTSSDGIEIRKPGKRREKYMGYDDTIKYYNESMKVLRELSEENRVRSFKVNDEWLKKDMEKSEKSDDKALLSLGIKEIDDYLGELRRGNMLGILGPPKGGKTRFSNYIVQLALRKGLNVCIWPLEGTPEEWISNQVTCRIAMESADERAQDAILRLDSKKVLQNRYSEPSIKREIASAKTYLATSEDCGRLSFIEGAAYCEDFLDVLQDHYDNENPFDVLVIDSLVNILSRYGKGKSERISDAYMRLQSFIKTKLRKPALAIMPAQLKQDTVDFLRKNPDETIDVTGGGESAETIRTPDEVIGLFSSKEERTGNIMHMYHVASRHSQSFPDFMCRCYLECCYFAHLEQ